MVITHLGGGTVRIQNGDTVILIDSTNARRKAAATLHTKSDLSETPTPELGEITFPGEYEAESVDIRGIQCGSSAHEVTTCYFLRWDGIKVLVVGDHEALPSGKAMEEISELNPSVVILPMSTEAQADWSKKIAKQLDASVVIPTSYASLKDIKHGFGSVPEEVERYTFKKGDLETLVQQLIVISPTS